ncbi:hypothetical protein ACFPPD_26935 [Cohnella suwonensis]|uniref:Lipoprotein n=1 Tax=Cohnella suwonensis TaxID=696072 RepID=A0ABW0M2G4_9BACL
MFRTFFLLIIISLILVGCNSTKTFKGSLDEVKGKSLMINCSSEINKGKKNINDIGYICEVLINDKTEIFNNNSKAIKIEEIPIDSNLEIHLNKSVNLKKNRNGLIANKIIRMNCMSKKRNCRQNRRRLTPCSRIGGRAASVRQE